MDNWRKQLKFDPLLPLLSAGNEAILYFVKRDLLGEQVGDIRHIWQLPEAEKILKKPEAID